MRGTIWDGPESLQITLDGLVIGEWQRDRAIQVVFRMAENSGRIGKKSLWALFKKLNVKWDEKWDEKQNEKSNHNLMQ